MCTGYTVHGLMDTVKYRCGGVAEFARIMAGGDAMEFESYAVRFDLVQSAACRVAVPCRGIPESNPSILHCWIQPRRYLGFVPVII